MDKIINKRLKKLRKDCDENVLKFKVGKSAFNDFDNEWSSIIDAENELQEYLDDDGDSCFAWLTLNDSGRKYYGNFFYESLIRNELYMPSLVRSADLFDKYVSLAIPMIETYRSKHCLWDANVAGLYLSLNLMLGKWDVAERITRVYHHYLSDKEQSDFVSIGDDQCRSTWFLFNLMCDELGLEYDQENVSYPKKMSPYDEVQKNWKEGSLLEFDKLVYKMADYHLVNSGDNYVEGMTEDEDYDAEGEFSDSFMWFTPLEIMAVLRLREKHGIENPKEFMHPLMNQPLAQLPKLEDIPAPEPYPIADKVLAKILKTHPEMESYLK